MALNLGNLTDDMPPDLGDEVWVDVLQAVDKTYAELVDYQEQLESRSAELRNLRSFLSSVMSSISDFLVVADKDGHIEDVSASFATVIGMTGDQLIRRQIGDFFAGQDKAKILETIAQAISLRQEYTVEVNLTTADGTTPVEFRAAPRLDRRRKIAGVVLAGRPLGELRQAYAELEESHEALKQTQIQLVRNEKLASLGRLLAGVAHELNNPISFVYANTHSLEKYLDRFETYFEHVQAGASREELVELRQSLRLERDLRNLRTAIEGARDGSERVRCIVEDLRRLSAEGSGDSVPFDLAEVARIAANWVQRGTKTELTITFDGQESCIAVGRAGHIQQVVMNLVQNAVDAMNPSDAPEIRLNIFHDGDHAVLEVCDNGPGIPDDVAVKIFDPFFTTKEVGKGTGLGLSISAKIAEEHKGQLSLISDKGLRDGAGACFRLELPRQTPV
ncbi:MAG: sensor histidine kinase [Mangrovicoccus sp.]